MRTAYRDDPLSLADIDANYLNGHAKPIVVLHPFNVGSDVAWSYDMKLMQTQTLAKVKAKIGKSYQITADASSFRPSEALHARRGSAGVASR